MKLFPAKIYSYEIAKSIAKSMKSKGNSGNSVLLPANVEQWPLLQRGLMNFHNLIMILNT